MSLFRDDLKRDLDGVFFNFGEFSVLHRLNNVFLSASTRRYTERLTDRQSEDYDVVHGETLIVTFRAEDFLRKAPRLPHEKERVKFDDVWYDVEHAENEFGACRLTLSTQRGQYG